MLADLPQERLDYVRELRDKGHKTYLLSNGNDLHFGLINDTFHLDRYFDRMFLSQELHLAKPEKEIYEFVEQAINPNHEPVVFIDDLEKNRRAAEQAVGWRTAESIEKAKRLEDLKI
jgi:putative hydrolase of the HAD superfamily